MIGRDPFEKLVTLLAHLGPPENQPLQLTDRYNIFDVSYND